MTAAQQEKVNEWKDGGRRYKGFFINPDGHLIIWFIESLITETGNEITTLCRIKFNAEAEELAAAPYPSVLTANAAAKC